MARTFVRIVKRWFSAVTVVSLVASIASSPMATSAAGDQYQTQTRAATWSTWLLSNASELRVGPPPDGVETQAELDQLLAFGRVRDGAALDRISYWDAGAPSYRWIQRAVKYAQSHGVTGLRAYRLTALLSVALSDAVVAATDSQQTYNRPRPALASAAIAAPATPGYPDERGAAAGAAETVLAYAFPSDADLFSSWASDAAQSRVEAGVAYPSDSATGRALGRQVGERAVAWGKSDGSDAKWTGSVPTEPGKWTGANPTEPLAGSWKTWALTSGSQFRPGPPPAVDSEQLVRDLAEVKNYPRTNFTNLTASFFEYNSGYAGAENWNDRASRLIFEHRLQDDVVQASRVYALVNIALIDAGVACYDAKYAYWGPRPWMLDPTITTVFAPPNHPSYPSSASCNSAAAAAVLGRQFPSEVASLNALVDQAEESRIMAGIHFRTDVDTGKALGLRVGEAVWTRGN
jgi:membrane-associated phospholipid phosphatase